MIGNNGEFGPVQVGAKVLDSPNHCQALTFRSRVVQLSAGELLAGEGHCVVMTSILVVLRQARRDGSRAPVTLDNEGAGEVGTPQDRLRSEAIPQVVERTLLRITPLPAGIIGQEGRKRQRDGRIITDEAAVIAAEAQESAHVAHGTGDGKGPHRSSLARARGDGTVRAMNLMAQIDQLVHPKLTFLRFDFKPGAPQTVKDRLQVLHMLLDCIAPNEHIIDETMAIVSEQALQDNSHHACKNGRAVA
jgi:hypothetical protein